jgi:hypothetical protein
MNTTIKTEKWLAKVMPEEIKIDEFIYRPGGAKAITSLLAFAGSMHNMKVLPPQIEDPPFVIAFSEYGDLTLHSGDEKKFVIFKFEDVDDLIVLVNDLVKVSMDNHTLRPHARGRAQFSTLPGSNDIV